MPWPSEDEEGQKTQVSPILSIYNYEQLDMFNVNNLIDIFLFLYF